MDAHLLVRWLHVAAAMLIGGGAVLVTVLCWQFAPLGAGAIIAAARRYELVFWAAFGLVVAAGVGNLGALGEGLPRPGTEWGTALTLKLGLVAVLAAVSALRTLLVAGLAGFEEVRALAVLRVVYSATSVLVLIVVGVAEVLAHG
jgi:hypothetical protein